MSLRDEKRKNFFLNNTKSAKKNTKGTKQMERRGWRPEEYLCLLCSSLRFLCSSSARSSAYPGAHGSLYRTDCAIRAVATWRLWSGHLARRRVATAPRTVPYRLASE